MSVQPAGELNSPADSVVGTAIERTAGGFTGGRSVRPSAWMRARKLSSCAGSVTSLPRHRPTIFAASVTEPPPTVSSASARASRAAFAAATTSMRGVWAPIFAQTPASLLPSTARTRSITSVCRASVPLAST